MFSFIMLYKFGQLEENSLDEIMSARKASTTIRTTLEILEILEGPVAKLMELVSN